MKRHFAVSSSPIHRSAFGSVRLNARAAVQRLAMVVMVGSLFGCASIPGVPRDGATPRRPLPPRSVPTRRDELEPRKALLQVSNNTFDEQPVYLISADKEIPMGSVAGFSTRTFLIARGQMSASGGYRLASHRHGATDGFFSEPFEMKLGDVVSWTIDRTNAGYPEVRALGGAPRVG